MEAHIKYLVQGDFLTEAPKMEKPGNYDTTWCAECSKYLAHLASLPKICRCEGLKDGAIVEEGVDYQYKYQRFIDGPDKWTDCEKIEYDNISWQIWETHRRKVAIPLHREQFYCAEYGKNGYTCETQCNHCASTPAPGDDDWRKRLQALKDKHGWNDPSPQPEQAGEKRSMEFIYEAFANWYHDDGSYDEFLQSEAFKAIQSYAQTLAGALWQAASQEKPNIIDRKDLDTNCLMFPIPVKKWWDNDTQCWGYTNDEYNISGYGKTEKEAHDMFLDCVSDALVFIPPKPAPDTVQGQDELWEEAAVTIRSNIQWDDSSTSASRKIIEELKPKFTLTKNS